MGFLTFFIAKVTMRIEIIPTEQTENIGDIVNPLQDIFIICSENHPLLIITNTDDSNVDIRKSNHNTPVFTIRTFKDIHYDQNHMLLGFKMYTPPYVNTSIHSIIPTVFFKDFFLDKYCRYFIDTNRNDIQYKVYDNPNTKIPFDKYPINNTIAGGTDIAEIWFMYNIHHPQPVYSDINVKIIYSEELYRGIVPGF
jgi:hypothetical protein